MFARMEEKLHKLPIGVQDFESLRMDGYVYIDKTKYLHHLVNAGRYYFLSRPRRFGKSLFLSTLKAYFEGKRELFYDTYIGKHEEEWTQYPVLKIDFNAEDYTSVDRLEGVLNDFLCKQEAKYGSEASETTPGLRFQGIIERACRQCGQRVVILVDEYDKPLLHAIDNPELQDAFRRIMKGFYGVLKSQDAFIRFAFITGVTRFSKISVFSDLNNLNDISMNNACHNICGITEDELTQTFPAEIQRLADGEGMTYDECLAALRRHFDGYHFRDGATGIYNPFSILKTFYNNEISSYWFESGTPTYLMKLLKLHDWNLRNMEFAHQSVDQLNGIDSEMSNPIPVIYQSGYLTIKGYDAEFSDYILGFPNEEVEQGFIKYLAPFYLSRTENRNAFDVRSFVYDVRGGNVDDFCRRLKALFADTPYEQVKDLENHYQNIVWIVFKIMGFYTQTEYHTSFGRIDLVVKTTEYIYVMEFKLDGTAEETMAQINSKDYSLPFTLDGRKVFKIGMNFSSETRNIERYIIEQA